MTTLSQTEDKITDVETAHVIFAQKVTKTKQSIDALRVQESSLQREKDKAVLALQVQHSIEDLRSQKH